MCVEYGWCCQWSWPHPIPPHPFTSIPTPHHHLHCSDGEDAVLMTLLLRERQME